MANKDRKKEKDKSQSISKMPPTKQELQVVEQLCLIDDVFFEAFMSDLEAAQELIQILLDDSALIVEQSQMQKSIKNLIGRSVRLDALCLLGNGKYCNVEVQRSDNDDHLKRIRYNSSLIATSTTKTGAFFKDIVDTIIIFISEFDLFKRGLTTYHIDSVVREIGEKVDDGVQILCINTENKDNTIISELMDEFKKPDFSNPKFPKMSKRMAYMKHDEGGLKEVCELMEKYSENIAREREIKATIITSLRFKADKTTILDILKETYSLNDKEAERYYNMYKNFDFRRVK
ncbi:hypothetical protein P261_01005 [Lachnospiraceae bacterium TWA4]|nr:hypothetical protein P261_01005 [Lachnospiraceae bacterium TWA4]